MALWTPYAEEALDLSKSVKEERGSPTPSSISETRSVYTYPYITPNLPVETLPREHQARSFVSTTQPSPDSVRSAWSPYSKTTPSPTRSPDLFDTESLSDDVEYQAFERDALRAIAEKNGGTLLGNNPRMRRAVQTSQAVDDSYRRQRERNNYAAKQSRDRRKLREVRLAFQVTFLQKKLAALRAKLDARYCTRCGQCPC